jgi:hypothetical protein
MVVEQCGAFPGKFTGQYNALMTVFMCLRSLTAPRLPTRGRSGASSSQCSALQRSARSQGSQPSGQEDVARSQRPRHPRHERDEGVAGNADKVPRGYPEPGWFLHQRDIPIVSFSAAFEASRLFDKR